MSDAPTHFAPHPFDLGMFRAFRIDTCDVCECEVEAPNAGTVNNSERELLFMGLHKREETLPEIGHCEALGLATCDDCWKPEEDA